MAGRWPGWKVLELVEVAELPNRPSDLLEMAEDGYSSQSRLAVDLAFMSFVRRFRRMAEETELKPAPKPKKGARPLVQTPKHSQERLLEALGIRAEDSKGRDLLSSYGRLNLDELEQLAELEAEMDAGDDG